MEGSYEQMTLDALVGRVMSIEDITTGNPERDYIVRYRGWLRMEDTEEAYDLLTRYLKPYSITPLFRWEDDRHAVILVNGRPRTRAGNPVVNLVMFVLTLLSVMLVGGLYGMDEATAQQLEQIIAANPLEAARLVIFSGWPFAVSLLGILGAHEFGHYLVGRYHKVNLSLPYFIPMPLTIFGTMGAVINMKEPPKNRRHLIDIGLAGPFAGLVVAIPVLILGLTLSQLDMIPLRLERGMAFYQEGNSLLYLFLKYLVFGELLPSPMDYAGLPAWQYWLRYFFTGRPFPLGGMDVMLHPVALAGWAGILITALNLIPAGQLDGGHVMYVLLGRKRATRIIPLILIIIGILGFFWVGWWIWVALIFFLGRTYAEPLDQITPLDGRRRMLALLALVIFFLVFTPVPLIIVQ
jgi:membrane-associated protease RseP (regulator of RpoE activity)